MPRAYRLGRRQASVDGTARVILDAARRLVEAQPGSALSVAAVARAAGVTRATVYNRFGSHAGLLRALEPAAPPAELPDGDPRESLRRLLAASCARWATNPGLYRHLQPAEPAEAARRLAERLAAADALKPGCSLREAEDVIGLLAAFPTFERLHRDGRRSSAAVTDILMRLVGGILA